MFKLLDERKIGDTMSLGIKTEEDEVGIYIASPEVSCSLALDISKGEWDKFVEAINEADRKLKE